MSDLLTDSIYFICKIHCPRSVSGLKRLLERDRKDAEGSRFAGALRRTGETVAMVGGFARRQVFMVETRINTRFGAGSWSHDLTMSWKFLLANTNSHHKTSLPAQAQATRVRASCDRRPPIHALLSLFIRLAQLQQTKTLILPRR